MPCIVDAQAYKGPANIYASDPWYPPMPGSLRNLKITCDKCDVTGRIFQNQNFYDRLLYDMQTLLAPAQCPGR